MVEKDIKTRRASVWGKPTARQTIEAIYGLQEKACTGQSPNIRMI